MDFAKIFLALLIAVQITSCSPRITVTDEVVQSSSVVHEDKREAEDEYTSPAVIENHLEPLDDFSWEMTEKPEYIVLHFTSDVVASRDNPYNLESVRKIFEENSLSIHYIIDREGVIYCYVPEDRSAWHAGKGEWLGDEKYTNKMNKYSIGIEVMAIGSQQDMAGYLHDWEYKKLDDSLKGYTEAQYESLAALVKDICERNNIPLDRDHVIGHQEYSPKKKDPGQLFDWSRIVPEG